MDIHTVWLADDDDDDCEIFKEVLNSLDIPRKVIRFNNGVDLTAGLDTTSRLPDLLILDVNMPLKDGITCLREIRSNPRLKELPVVIWSTSDTEETILQSFELRANRFIRKPSTFVELKQIINITLSQDLTLSAQLEEFCIKNDGFQPTPAAIRRNNP